MSVPAVRTPLTMAQQAQALARAWRDALGEVPRALLELTLAHVALENKQGQAIWNNNPGNLTTNGQNFYTLDSLSVNAIGERISQDDPTRVVLHFWAFDEPSERFAAYVNWLRKHPALLNAGLAGDALAFAQAIKSTDYTPYIEPQRVARSLAAMVGQIRSDKLLADYELKGPGVLVVPLQMPAWVWGLAIVAAWGAFRGK